MTREESSTGSQTAIVFLLSILFVYFILSAQYESYILPLAVIFTIPAGMLGVFTFIKLAGIENNIYVQVGLIMLVGLLSKNAILIVEYAVQRRRQGMSIVESALEACATSVATNLNDIICFYCWFVAIGLGNRRISIWQSFNWYRRCWRNAYRRCVWRVHHSCFVCDISIPAGKNYRRTKAKRTCIK